MQEPSSGSISSTAAKRWARKRFVVGAVATLVLVAIVWDIGREPAQQWTAALLLAGIDAYQARLSPGLSVAGINCRFRPTCSEYAEATIRQEGAAKGSWRAARRLARCGPWTPAGTEDPP